MKKSVTLKTILVIMLFLSGLNIQAQVSKQVNVKTAGTLSMFISSSVKDQITNLTVTGKLNGKDIRFIREMASSNKSKLTVLDLSGANIVEGGDSYFFYLDYTDNNNVQINLYTSNNTIGDYFFIDTKLTSIVLPKTVTSIDSLAFVSAFSLNEIQISEDNTLYTTVDGILFNKDKTELIFYPASKKGGYTVPNSVTSINSCAFRNCRGITSVFIPNSVTSIGAHAFNGCGYLTSATIGTGVTTIGEKAFSNCAGLKEIYNNNTTPQSIELTVFQYFYKYKCTLYVPIGAKENYLAAPEWKDFGTIIESDITSTNQLRADAVKVYTEGETIVVEGVQSGEAISICTQAGALIQKVKATDDRVKINLPNRAIYLVKTANRTFKVAL